MRYTKKLVHLNVGYLRSVHHLDISVDSNANGMRLENAAGFKTLTDRMTTSQMGHLVKGIYLGMQLQKEKETKQ